MALTPITNPPMTNTTGLSIVQKLNEIKQAVQPVNPCMDIDISLPTSGWSGNGPYTYTYSNEHITSGCLVKANFLESENAPGVLHLDYEKVTGGVRFESNKIPSYAIPIRLHVLNADATSTSATTADAVSTDAVSGASNVQDALSSLSDQIANITTRVNCGTIASEGSASVDYPTGFNYGNSRVIGHGYTISNGDVYTSSVDVICRSSGMTVYNHTGDSNNLFLILIQYG